MKLSLSYLHSPGIEKLSCGNTGEICDSDYRQTMVVNFVLGQGSRLDLYRYVDAKSLRIVVDSTCISIQIS